MAPLSFSPKVADLRSKVYDGRRDQARREAQALLREGFAHQTFLDFVADLLEPVERGRGQPTHPPQKWLDIGYRFQIERDEGLSKNRAYEKLAAEFNATVSTIRRAVEFYERAENEARDAK